MLKLTNLSVGIEDINILDDINLDVKAGEIHVIMGPPGSGKSTLLHSIAGNPDYKISKGRMTLKRKSLNVMPPEERSKLGIFLTFQDPPEIPGMNNLQLTRELLRAHNDTRETTNIIADYKKFVKMLDMGTEWSKREANVATSLGERKKNEVLQMQMLDPTLLLLDEIDGGLDTDSVKEVGNQITKFLASGDKAAIIVSQQPAILSFVKPTHVHVMVEGKIVESGTYRILKRILKNGYREFS